jgi:K+-sensing histidine kinase KdpD
MVQGDPRQWDIKSLIQVLENVSQTVDRLSDLVREILEMADLASGTISLVRERVDLSALLSEAVEWCRFKLTAAHFTLQLKADRPIYASLDQVKVRECIQDLLNAAISLGKRKTIQVDISREGDKARLGIRVGTHPTQEDQLRSLGEFQRALIVEQLGLSVYLANEIIEAHGGWLRIFGDLRDDFSFIVRLPLEAQGQFGGPEPVRIGA